MIAHTGPTRYLRTMDPALRRPKDVNTMPSIPLSARRPGARPGSSRLPRCLLSLLVLPAVLFLSVALAPRAAAQACGPTLAVTANQWSMVGVPCVPPGSANTAAAFFGPSLNAAAGAPSYGYNVTWVLWKKGYDPVTCAGASDPNNCYVKLAATDTVSAGDAFWLYTTLAATLDFTAPGATATPGPHLEFPAQSAPDNANPRYYMFANPYGSTVNWADLRFLGMVGGASKNYSTQEAVDKQKFVTANIYYWNGNTYFTRSLTSIPAATFEPNEGAWMEMLRGVPPFAEDLTVRVPKPAGAP